MRDRFLETMPSVSSMFHPADQLVIYTGDCLAALEGMPDNVIQLLITSPPYNVGKDYENVTCLDRYLAQLEPILRELVRVLRPQGSLCWQVGNYVENGEIFPLDIYYYPLFKRLGLQLRNRIVWHFEHGLHACKRFSGRYEVLLWFTKSDDYTFNLDSVRVPAKYPGKRHFKGPKKGLPSGNPLGKNPSDCWSLVAQDWEREIWDIPNVKANHPEKTGHPCQFPIELVQRCVLALTNEDEWLMDPFMGVGSSLIGALMHGRRAMGCEKEAQYVRLARDRIARYYAGTLRVRPLGRAVHEPTGKEKVAQRPDEWVADVNGGLFE